MATKTDNTQLENILGDIKAGRAVSPEMVDAAVKSSALDEDAINQRALVQTPGIEWETATTAQYREPIRVPEHLISGEEAANAALKDTQVEGEPPTGTGSNDPAVNPGATGGEPFANDAMVGTSGQVIDAASYREDEETTSSTTTAKTTAKKSSK